MGELPARKSGGREGRRTGTTPKYGAVHPRPRLFRTRPTSSTRAPSARCSWTWSTGRRSRTSRAKEAVAQAAAEEQKLLDALLQVELSAGPGGSARRPGRSAGCCDRLSLRARRTLWAWAFLALPVVFYVAIRFYPTAEALLRVASPTGTSSAAPRSSASPTIARLVAGPGVLEGDRQHLRSTWSSACRSASLLSFVIAYHLDRVRFGHGLLRALYFVPHLTTAVAMAWVWRWLYQPLPIGAVQRVPGRGWASRSMPFLRSTDAGAASRAGARDLGRARLPDRDLPGRPEGDPAHLLRGGGDRRRRRAGASLLRGHAAAPAPDHRVPGGDQLDRLPAHLRLRLRA